MCVWTVGGRLYWASNNITVKALKGRMGPVGGGVGPDRWESGLSACGATAAAAKSPLSAAGNVNIGDDPCVCVCVGLCVGEGVVKL